MHVSDCSFNNGGTCDCCNLDLAFDVLDSFVATFVPVTGRFGFFVDYMGGESFIEPHVLPALTLAAIATAANLPDAHDLVAVAGQPDSVNFNDAREAVISKLKAKTSAEGIASGLCVQMRISLQPEIRTLR